MVELKINDTPISEFKDVGALAKALGETLDKYAVSLQKMIRGRHSFSTGFPDMGENMRRYNAITDNHLETLKAIDKLFGTDYSDTKKLYDLK